jgi:hypothetical protein
MRGWRFGGVVVGVLAGLCLFLVSQTTQAGTIVKSETVSISALVTDFNPGTGGSGGGGGAGFILFPIIIDPPLFPEFTVEERPRICSRTADYNCDGFVNIVDFSILIYWFDRMPVPPEIDLTQDDRVDLRDFSVMAYYWYE